MKVQILHIFLPLLLALIAAPNRAPAAQILNPPDGATNVCPDTLLRVTFDAPPGLQRSGQITLRAASGELADTIDLTLNSRSNSQARTIGGARFTNYPVLISGQTAVICPHAGVLRYGQTYRVTISPGVFADFTNEISWTFTTCPAGPATNAARLVVAGDGSGDFCTVQGAVDFVPAGNTQPREIFILSGVYEEIVFVTNRHHLTFRGEDRTNTTIQYANNENFNYRTLGRNVYRQTFGVSADDFTLENLTVRNTTPKRGSQAEALRIDGRRCVVRNVDFYSFQDTLKLSGTVFISCCYVEGDVDFIWGTGTCFFTNCEIKCVNNGACITQIRNTATNFGDVFVDSPLTPRARRHQRHPLAHRSGPLPLQPRRVDQLRDGQPHSARGLALHPRPEPARPAPLLGIRHHRPHRHQPSGREPARANFPAIDRRRGRPNARHQIHPRRLGAVVPAIGPKELP